MTGRKGDNSGHIIIDFFFLFLKKEIISEALISLLCFVFVCVSMIKIKIFGLIATICLVLQKLVQLHEGENETKRRITYKQPLPPFLNNPIRAFV